MEHYPSPAPNSSGMSCHALYAEEKGFMWVGTYSGGLVKFNTETKTWRYIPPDDEAEIERLRQLETDLHKPKRGLRN